MSCWLGHSSTASNLGFFGVGNCRFSLSQSLMMSDDDLEASLVAKLPFCASKLVTVHDSVHE